MGRGRMLKQKECGEWIWHNNNNNIDVDDESNDDVVANALMTSYING